MSTINARTWNDWLGATVVDRDGDKIGSLENVYMDRATGQPEWLTVKTGLFGHKHTFVPLADATAVDDDLRVPYEKALVKDAPNIDPDDGFLTGEDEARLYQHYGRSDYRPWSDDERDIGGGDTRSNQADQVRLRRYMESENGTTTAPSGQGQATRRT